MLDNPAVAIFIAEIKRAVTSVYRQSVTYIVIFNAFSDRYFCQSAIA